MNTRKIEVQYIPLSAAILWDRNPKKHDFGELIQSIKENGFRSPPEWDSNLNNGEGGIVAGNGRIQALRMLFNMSEDERGGIPKYISVDEKGEWYVPIIFGADADSKAQAEKYAVDHNNLTMMGGDFAIGDIMKMWQSKEYMELLKDLANNEEMPVSVKPEDFEAMINYFNDDKYYYDEDDEEEEEEDEDLIEKNVYTIIVPTNTDREKVKEMVLKLQQLGCIVSHD